MRPQTQSQPKWLTQEQVEAFFAAIPKAAVRDRLLFGFIYRYGMRASEACDLPTSFVDVRLGQVRILGLKRGLERVYPLFRELERLARRWQPGPRHYFRGRQGALTRGRVWQLFRLYARAAGISDGYGPHSLRHSAAVHVLDSGASVEEARDLLRHRDISSTLVYAELSPKRRQNYLAKLEESGAMARIA